MNKPSLVFEYSTPIKADKAFHYRVLLQADGFFRVEKKGLTAKRFRTCCWGGDEESHYNTAVYVCRRGNRG